MTVAVLLRSVVMGNYHATFWRAVEGATLSLTLMGVSVTVLAFGGGRSRKPASQGVGITQFKDIERSKVA